MSTTDTAPAAQASEYEEADVETYRPRNLTLEQVRSFGSIGNLNEGIEIKPDGISTRLLAWPGIGYPNQGLHVLTLTSGQTVKHYSYAVSEEALFCIRGKGMVYIRDGWYEVEAGDIAYCPEGVAHALSNPYKEDFVLVTQITPPQVQLYEQDGYYDQSERAFNFDLIAKAQKAAGTGDLPADDMQLHYNDSHPEIRSWNLTNESIRSGGALFNIFVGADFTGIEVPMKLVLFPGFGTRLAGLHVGYVAADAGSDVHSHPISEDCVITHMGTNWAYIDGKRVRLRALDVAMASVQALHGGVPGEGAEAALMTGFGAPAQQDLYMDTPYYDKDDGTYSRPESTRLEIPAAQGSS
jgi:gentisate 1,2-dioxygenase